ncbi:MAG: FtsH protease activity modulator HflK [Alphaproteobacteria bacterium]
MPWQNNPGNRGNGGGPWGQGPRPTGPTPPNLDDILKKGQDRMRGFFPGGFGGKTVAIIVAILVGLWAVSGFFRVQPGEQGVVLIFGKWDGDLLPEGLHWAWPTPIGEVFTPRVAEVRRLEVGFQSRPGRDGEVELEVASESLMLTGDENIIDIDFEVFWVINDAGKYLFNIQEQEETVKGVAESAMREVIGQTTLEIALTQGRRDVESRTRTLMQSMLDDYQGGVTVTEVNLKKSDTPPEVIDDFRDVQAAGADREALINDAERYRAEIIPVARGQAAQIMQQSEAYKAEVVARSQGEASRFVAVYDEYIQAQDVTRKRIYLETMEQILRDVNKIIIDDSAGSGVVPYLPLPEVQKRRQEAQ